MPTAIYIYILSNMINNNWFVSILCYCKSNIDIGSPRFLCRPTAFCLFARAVWHRLGLWYRKNTLIKKISICSFNVTNKIIKCLLFALNIVCSILFYKAGNFTPEMFSVIYNNWNTILLKVMLHNTPHPLSPQVLYNYLKSDIDKTYYN
jgi:hypothetical protein